ncbi:MULTISPECIES: spherulation-specific family 4 protein [unclassified Streptomyces]|uniref:spherulation-specific family 4 protein n=1 Tax=unclassified Streptomyces TaxID=2593676 RepID=UPI002E1DC9D8|nr:spherulation-specific family 4 protein [Streptomyces sp. NBC_01023]
MPHLTPGATLSAELGFGVPGYAHPLVAPVEWAELARPGTPLHWVVLNVDNGPGDRPDPHCLAAAGRLRNAGTRVLGHLDMAHGTRAFGELIAEAHRFADWYRTEGFFLDRAPADRADLPETRRIADALRSVTGPGGRLVLGHGVHPYPGYAETADQLVTFSGPWTDYRWSQVAEWTADYDPSRFAHFVHGVPRTHLEEAVRIARWQGAGTIFFTDRTDRTDRTGGTDPVDGADGSAAGRPEESAPFEALPGYWDEIVSRIGPGVSE